MYRRKLNILVVDDHADTVAVLKTWLVDEGHQVIGLTDLGDVESMVFNHAVDVLLIDLLFSDVVIPGGTNGAQLAVEARRLRPELKVLLTSGYTAAALSLEHGLPDNLSLVGKPYQREELAKQLRLVIGR